MPRKYLEQNRKTHLLHELAKTWKYRYIQPKTNDCEFCLLRRIFSHKALKIYLASQSI